MTNKPKKWGHDALAADLAQYLRETRGMLAWEDMQLGPAGSPRPDVYAINKSYAKFRPLVYECKVSVSDFRADVTKGKWHSYLQYACGVIFAAPAGLISKADLPEGCGLIQRSDNGWRMAKGPTMQPLENMPRDAWLKLLMDGTRREGERHRLEYRHHYPFRAHDAVRRRFGEDVASLVAEAQQDRDRLRHAIENDRKRRAEVAAGTEAYVKKHRERMEREAARLSEAYRGLAEELGLQHDATIHELILAIQNARQRLTGDTELQTLRGYFQQVQRLAERSLRELPQPGAAPERVHPFRRREG